MTALAGQHLDFVLFVQVFLNRFVSRNDRIRMGKLFGTDGIRGRANEYPVTSDMARRLGRAVVQVLGRGETATVLIGRDTRESGQVLESALAEGLLAAGARVLKLGVVPSPAVALLVKELKATAAVMLTASHNPYEDNGMKIFGGDGYKLPDQMEQELEELLLAEVDQSGEAGGTVEDFPEGIEIYAKAAVASIGGTDLQGLRLVLDAGNGAAYQIGPAVFRRLGAEVIEVAVQPNGRNINDGCGALYAEAAGRVVRENGADLGISLDGDGDRVIFTTAAGDVVHGDRALALCALCLQRGGKLRDNKMVATVMSNLGLDEAMRKEGIEVIRAGVGDRLVLEKMRAENLSFGGENSGHLIFADHATTGDGIVSALQVCKMIRESGKSLACLSSVISEYPSKLLNLPVREKPPLESLPKLQSLIAEADAEFGNEGRQLIRYSGTEKKIRILVEHKDAATVDRWIEKFARTIEEEIG